jgi:hypothetical protein
MLNLKASDGTGFSIFAGFLLVFRLFFIVDTNVRITFKSYKFLTDYFIKKVKLSAMRHF